MICMTYCKLLHICHIHDRGESADSVLRKVEQLIFFAEIEGTDEVQLQ